MLQEAQLLAHQPLGTGVVLLLGMLLLVTLWVQMLQSQ
jgi:hypothetical protein